MNSTRKHSVLLSFHANLIVSGNRETAVVRVQDETPNDRNDRGMHGSLIKLLPVQALTQDVHTPGIRKAVAWYSSHISLMNPTIRGQRPRPKPTVLLLTDDVQNRIKGEKEGIKCASGKVSVPQHERDFHLW